MTKWWWSLIDEITDLILVRGFRLTSSKLELTSIDTDINFWQLVIDEG
jgi:hypothetical protein